MKRDSVGQSVGWFVGSFVGYVGKLKRGTDVIRSHPAESVEDGFG